MAEAIDLDIESLDTVEVLCTLNLETLEPGVCLTIAGVGYQFNAVDAGTLSTALYGASLEAAARAASLIAERKGATIQ